MDAEQFQMIKYSIGIVETTLTTWCWDDEDIDAGFLLKALKPMTTKIEAMERNRVHDKYKQRDIVDEEYDRIRSLAYANPEM